MTVYSFTFWVILFDICRPQMTFVLYFTLWVIDFDLRWIQIPSIKFIQAVLLMIQCLQGFQTFTSNDQCWPQQKIIHMYTKQEAHPPYIIMFRSQGVTHKHAHHQQTYRRVKSIFVLPLMHIYYHLPFKMLQPLPVLYFEPILFTAHKDSWLLPIRFAVPGKKSAHFPFLGREV